ncbi:MAG: BBP7 family outer membrane beta-barrel protein [Planctomycetaceae bacterium]|nr:BBP7 family outer membrane beta-barrel protein [Planctomycetaceae bacterium]
MVRNCRFTLSIMTAICGTLLSVDSIQAGLGLPFGHSSDCCESRSACDLNQVFCNPCPTFTSNVKFVYMQRTQTGNGAIVANSNTNQVLLKGDQYDFGFQPGIDTNLIYHLNPTTGVEFRYLWIDEWSESAFTPNPNPGALRYLTNPVTGDFGADFASEYTSSLQTAEINLRKQAGNITWLVGFRWAEIDENLQVNGLPPVLQSFTSFNTSNNLYGLQVGLEAPLYSRGRFSLDTFGKLGWYANQVEGDSQLILGNAVLGQAHDSRTDPALLAEAGLEGVYHINQFVALRLGYQLFLAHGIAVAPEQVKRTGSLVTNPSTLNLDTTDSLFAHGITGGLEFTW